MVWGLEYIQYLENNWRKIAERVKEVAKTLGKVDKVVVFGSVIKGEMTGSSHLDIAVFYDEDLTDKEKIRRTLEIVNRVDEEIADINLQVMNRDEEDFFLNKFVDKYVEID
ncbi:nucleotidyltransferase domain-containing protein [Sulfuracidifex metallicus]|uniref:nucleotidyltransferase domain-containing protein n=1 Tax=Sulfuracidifex metallicus TaxID=47303 RepID=UPI0006D0A2F0|nr:nucleotidyltransferase domain-containing protein [Sulfuracidifex metallicus]